MSHRSRLPLRLFLVPFLLAGAVPLFAQALAVGSLGIPGAPIPLTGTSTVLELGFQANHDGQATEATFSWSAAPCPAAVKIKFFRPSSALPGGQFFFVDQRGPFDVTSTLQTVRLDPPVALQTGDIIAITNVTSCGAPVSATRSATLPATSPFFVVAGDVTTTIVPATQLPSAGPFVSVFADDGTLSLLNGRFRVSLIATNPRTGQITNGTPVTIENSAGYFSLPELTSDPQFPEVMVKMVDATGSPSLGGTFWVFHSPLTDTSYRLTILDTLTGRTRLYTNSSGGPGQLCGGVDTSAFLP